MIHDIMIGIVGWVVISMVAGALWSAVNWNRRR